jgi:hypothetical protein
MRHADDCDEREHQMARPITLFTGQWADLPFTEMCRLASEWGYDGLEVACWGDHLDVVRAAEDDGYVRARLDLLEKHDLRLFAISNHLAGQAVCVSALLTLPIGEQSPMRARALPITGNSETLQMSLNTTKNWGIRNLNGVGANGEQIP